MLKIVNEIVWLLVSWGVWNWFVVLEGIVSIKEIHCLGAGGFTYFLIVIAFIDCLYEHIKGNISRKLSLESSFVGTLIDGKIKNVFKFPKGRRFILDLYLLCSLIIADT